MRQSSGARIVDILLKFSSIVFVKYHVCFLFADHFDQIELMFIQWRGAGLGQQIADGAGGGRIIDIDGVYKWVYGIETLPPPQLKRWQKTNLLIESVCSLLVDDGGNLVQILRPLCYSFSK